MCPLLLECCFPQGFSELGSIFIFIPAYSHIHIMYGYMDNFTSIFCLYFWVPLSAVCLFAQSPVGSHLPNYTRLPLCSVLTLSLQRSPLLAVTSCPCHLAPESSLLRPCYPLLSLPDDSQTEPGRRETIPNFCFLIRRNSKQKLNWDYWQWLLLCSLIHLWDLTYKTAHLRVWFGY